jgi:hypothetical protein
MAVKLLGFCASRPLPPERFLVLITDTYEHLKYSSFGRPTKLNDVRLVGPFPGRERVFLFMTSSRPALRATNFLYNAYGKVLPRGQNRRGVKLAIPSPTYSDKVKNIWPYTCIYHTIFPPRRPEFQPESGHVGFCDGQKWRWGQVFSDNLGFPCQSTFHLLLHNHLHYHPRLAQ